MNRAEGPDHDPADIWSGNMNGVLVVISGLPGSGKSTIADALGRRPGRPGSLGRPDRSGDLAKRHSALFRDRCGGLRDRRRPG